MGGTRSEIAVPALACLELVELDERVDLHRGQRTLQLLAAEELRLDVLPGPLLAADAACREHLSSLLLPAICEGEGGGSCSAAYPHLPSFFFRTTRAPS